MFTDKLIVGVNSDKCGLMKKKQPCFMDFRTRCEIVKAIKGVDEVCDFDDKDGTACLLLQKVYNRYQKQIQDGTVELIFVNGGDRQKLSTPEQDYVDEYLDGKITMMYGIGGNHKLASSSDFLRNWVNNTMIRYDVRFRVYDKY